MKKGIRMFSEEEVMPYRRRRPKNRPKKSTHKHNYKYFIKNCSFWSHKVVVKVCKECKKEEIVSYWVTDRWREIVREQ